VYLLYISDAGISDCKNKFSQSRAVAKWESKIKRKKELKEKTFHGYDWSSQTNQL
jgi:hypothetical protein